MFTRQVDQLGQRAYEAYCEETDWTSIATGQDLPEWELLPDKIQRAWKMVAVDMTKYFLEGK